MSSAIGGLSAAKRRRGISQHAVAPTNTNTSRTQSFVSQLPDVNSNMIQVSPLEMLKMHEARLRRIETMESSETKGPEKQLPEIDELFQELLAELETTKKTADDTSTVIRELKTTVRSLQTLVTANARTISTMQSDIATLKTELATTKMATVSISETTSERTLESVPESLDSDDNNGE